MAKRPTSAPTTAMSTTATAGAPPSGLPPRTEDPMNQTTPTTPRGAFASDWVDGH